MERQGFFVHPLYTYSKNVRKSDRRWEPENFENLKTRKLENFENIKNDPWDMLNAFCFHVYAQKSLFLCENCNAFFGTSSAAAAAREFANPRAGSQLKIVSGILNFFKA